jgi:hypothetical protein
MVISVLLFALGIALLWLGTEAVLRRVPRLAAWMRVSPLVVTLLLVAVMTSLPEFTVSLFASLRGQPAAAVGNIVGSYFVTLTFVAGICALWRPIVVGRSIRQRESSCLLLHRLEAHDLPVAYRLEHLRIALERPDDVHGAHGLLAEEEAQGPARRPVADRAQVDRRLRIILTALDGHGEVHLGAPRLRHALERQLAPEQHSR